MDDKGCFKRISSLSGNYLELNGTMKYQRANFIS